MFDSLEYASYIELCHELRLERKFDTFDAVLDPNLGVMEWGWWTERQTRRDRIEDLVWLPRLDQWLAMLEKAAPDWTNTFSITRHEDGEFWATFEGRAAGNGGSWDGLGPTREEAAARLWMAVRKAEGVNPPLALSGHDS